MKKLVALLLVVIMCLGLVTGCSDTKTNTDGDKPVQTAQPDGTTPDEGTDTPDDSTTPAAPASYTYNAYTTALGNNWNPHTWETNADDSINDYITSPFCTMSILDSENGVYQWVYEMATSITDVTAANQGDLTKYNVTLPEGQTAETTTAGYVYEIKLNPEAEWANGEAITADDYIYSMQQLLAPEMHNYRANLYISGESALAGAYNYYYSGSPIYSAMVAPYETEGDYSYDLAAGIAAGQVYINLKTTDMTLASYTIDELINSYNPDGAEFYNALAGTEDAYGYILVTEENLETVKALAGAAVAPFGLEYSDEFLMEMLWVNDGSVSEIYSYDTVGCYKVDDYTIRYVNQTYIDINYFLTSCTSTWLVYEELYEAGKDTSGTLVTTNYGTSPETTMAYGPYMIESMQADKQIVFVQNPAWYGWEEQEDGSLLSFTNFDVDGEKKQQYQTTRVVIDVMEESAAKQAFLKGELSAWSPNAEELTTYATSDQLYKVDETYTMSFFFNTDVDALKEMDNSKGNTNSVVLSNTNFRKAFSLAIDRDEFVTATPGYKSAYALMNNLYFYDVYNDPNSSYRGSDPAMQAVCNLYGIEYGEGKAYATLKDAYQSVSGYNLTEAKNLMKTACDELVAAGLYTAGQDIVIRIGWAKGAVESSDLNQIALMNKFINAAAEGSGFGKITLEGIGNIDDRYSAVPGGEYAIGYGAWGGAAFYPFRNLQVYADPDQYDINEAACWDPKTETATLTIGGEDITMTWQDWSNALIGSGPYAAADNQFKLEVTAQLEQQYLEKYYRIPLCGTTICELLSFKNSYYTEEYNIMYDFGGLRLMTYNYTDAEWTEFVSSMGGTLSYE